MDYKEFLKDVKGVTEADHKFVQNVIAKHMPATASKVVNPFTGYEKYVNPLLAALVYFTQEIVYSDFSDIKLKKYGIGKGNAYQLYDRARYLILKLDNDLYSNVID